ncbi:nicotinate-nucleotide--dimethylbenzimidazole phosphoribosyltransferase [Nocardioides nanhaiensis]|uniref:Nicotinate-nucleotide--dimethylbenzimidazole phosphoribosyltransferase n=1 Tax=Nocardioides nanhaiensis TaxID=1476871 RepID=A0ABP8WIF6_9ACTN
MITPPSAEARREAGERLGALAVPAGALGRLGELGVWLAACQGQVPPAAPSNVRLAVFAGDHGVATHGVSAYPAAVTGAMLGVVAQGRSGVDALARAHGVHVRLVDVGVDHESGHALHVRRGSGAIHLEDALTHAETLQALEVGAAVAREEIAAGADLLLSGDLGIGNTTPAAALVAAGLGVPAEQVVGRGTGVDDAGLARKTAVVEQALQRAGARADDPVDCLTALGSADLAAAAGYVREAARAGVPVLLDGLMAVACALTAERLEPGVAAWCAAGHRSTEPGQSLALEKLGLEPLLDLGLRLGEGSGAVAAVPLVRAAAALLGEVALLAEVLPPDA